MKVTWLSLGGVLFSADGVKIAVDPVFTPVRELDVRPDVVIVTSSAKERFDKEYVKGALRSGAAVLACEGAYSEIVNLSEDNEPVLLSAHTVISFGGVTIYSVKAESSDRTAVGVIIDDGAKTYYVSGSTLYNYDVLDDVLDLAPDGVDYAFLPISGKGCNMNAKDAADFAYEIGAKSAVPVCFGDYNGVSCDEFDFDDALVLEPYREYELD